MEFLDINFYGVAKLRVPKLQNKKAGSYSACFSFTKKKEIHYIYDYRFSTLADTKTGQ